MAAQVFAIPVLEKWVVYAPLEGVVALVNRAALNEFPEELREAVGDAEPAPRPKHGPLSPQFLGIVPTRGCNLRCAYCGFGAAEAGGEQMSFELAVAGVDWMADLAAREGRRTLDVHFFGGEPLAAPDVVEVAIHRTRAAAAKRGLTPRLEVATNGIYDEARARWAGDYFDAVVLSFDGFREVHNRHRGRFDLVAATAGTLSASPAELCLRVCVTEDNVEQLAETVDWFAEEFRPHSIDFETLQPTPESERAGLSPPDPFAFAARFRAAQRVALERGVEPVYAAAAMEKPRLTFCPVGNDTVILHPDGSVSGCYLLARDWLARGMDLTFGRMGADGELQLDGVDRLRQLVADKPRCRDCFCRWSCAGGCHVNHSYPGCGMGFDDFCVQTRLITACALLDRMGQQELADALVADQDTMRPLAGRRNDRIECARGEA